jgi:hypothetical protein
VERITLATDGVVRITELGIDHNRANRRATIILSYEDIFGVQQAVNEAVEA